MAIHKTAIIADDAIIPASCEIGPNVIIGEGVVLGENVKIMASAYLEHCEIGDGKQLARRQHSSYHVQFTDVCIM